MRQSECADLKRRADIVLAGGPGTFSKASVRYPEGLAPYALVSGDGAYVVGSNGRTYLDTVAALGAILLGHNEASVTEAVVAQARRGTSFSLIHPLEIQVAEQLCAMLPCAEMVRFAKNGTDAVQMAVRLARAVTGHKHVLFTGYHGGGNDSYGVTTDKHAGILPQLAPYNHQVPWEHLDALPGWMWEDLACIVTEVPALPWGTSHKHHWAAFATMRERAHAHGGLFVLDEVVTFPRWGAQGAQGAYGVKPDLTCVSKGMANGWPLAALVGQRAIMERLNQGDIFASWTFAGETTALAAAAETLRLVQTTDAIAAIERHGQTLGDGLQAVFNSYHLQATVSGHPARIAVKWQDMPEATAAVLRTLWLAEMARRGILLGIGVIFPMACWLPQTVEFVLEQAANVCELMTQAIARDNVCAALSCPIITDVLSVRT